MKADLNIPEVTGVEIAVVQVGEDKDLWDVILINRTDQLLENVIITSKGYGEVNGLEQKTSVLRHLIEKLPPESYAKIEPIKSDVFHLTNEYWVSYYMGQLLHDKKYIFAPESIGEQNISDIPEFEMRGVLQK